MARVLFLTVLCCFVLSVLSGCDEGYPDRHRHYRPAPHHGPPPPQHHHDIFGQGDPGIYSGEELPAPF
jgi:hypothetical protein